MRHRQGDSDIDQRWTGGGGRGGEEEEGSDGKRRDGVKVDQDADGMID